MGYSASIALTVTNLHSLASSQDWSAGWSSVITTGTVDGVSVVGAVVASFTIRATSLSAAAMDTIVDLVWDEV